MTFTSESSRAPAAVPPDWRVAFLTASTWASATATPAELAFALRNYRPGQSPETAVATLKHRRKLESSGKLRVLLKAEAAVND